MNRLLRSGLRLLAAAALLLQGTPAPAQTRYLAVPLGTLEGPADMVFAADLNNAGQVAGSVRTLRGHRAFLWDPERGMANLGSMPGPRSAAGAEALNDAGLVVGGGRAGNPFAPERAFVWSHSEGMRGLDIPGARGSRAWAVNASGRVAGSAWVDSRERVFLWPADEGPQLPEALAGAQPRELADDGTVVGRLRLQGRPVPFVWHPERGLRTPALEPGTRGAASALAGDGTVVGRLSDRSGTRAFVWRPPAPLTILDGLPQGGGYAEALGVNAGGVVVGRAVTGAGMSAFVWDADSGMRALEGLIAGGAPPELQLFAAPAVNDAGQIVAYGRRPGERAVRSYLLTPVTPTARRPASRRPQVAVSPPGA